MNSVSPQTPVERLNRIDWQREDPSHHGSNIYLLRESAIRFARWAAVVEGADDTRSSIFFDVAGCIDPTIQLVAFDTSAIQNAIARRIAPWAQKWQVLVKERGFHSPEPDPFEPCLLCFERGGRPFTHHGFMHIEHSISFTFGYGAWPERFAKQQPTDIASVDLDRIDAEMNARAKQMRG